MSSFFKVANRDSATALPKAIAREPIEIAMPAPRAFWSKAAGRPSYLRHMVRRSCAGLTTRATARTGRLASLARG
jgi:hypothetical protein